MPYNSKIYSFEKFNEIIDNNALIFLTDDVYNNNIEYHSHEFYEIAYISKGSFYHRVNAKDYNLTRGDIVVLKIGDRHCYKMESESGDITNILFYPQFFKGREKVLNAFLQRLGNENIARLDSRDIHQFEAILKYMKYEQKLRRNDCNEIMKHYLDILFLIITRTNRIIKNSRNSKIDISAVLNYIAQNISTLKPSDIAKNASYNPAYFSKLFKETMGITLVKYINQKRIDAAIQLITETEASINDIARSVGFSDTNYFFRLFKQYTGVTPLSLRKNHSNDKN